jgi:hypothetical protein
LTLLELGASSGDRTRRSRHRSVGSVTTVGHVTRQR